MTNIDTSLDMAFDAYNHNQFETAEELVREVLTIAPTNGDALYLLGLIAYRSNALEPAEKLLYEAVKLYPQSQQYALALAGVLQKAGRLDEALSFYEKYKEDPLVLSQIGYIYLQKGQPDFAKSAFEESISKMADCLNAHIGLALLSRQNGENEKALEILTKSISLTPNPNSELCYQLAVQHRLCEQNNSALDWINRALLQFETAAFLNEKGLILEALNRDMEAQISYEQAVELDSYAPDAYANLGNLYMKESNFRRAEYYYKKALALDEDFLNAHHNLAIALCKQDRKAEGLEHYRSALLINPRHISTLYNLAMILEEMGDYSEAAGMYFNILTLKSHPEMIDFRIANTLSGLYETGKKEQKEALDFAKGWVKHYPENEIALHTLNALTHNRKDDSILAAYTRKLFDSFATTYDATMEKLQANALTLTADYINSIPEKTFNNILDLACGTGTFAELLNQNFNKLTGVDISEKMLALAGLKEKYTHLVQSDVIDFLEQTTENYDLILAVELTSYLSDLNRLFELTEKRLTSDGLFVVTVETNASDDIFLSSSGRYLYRKAYVQKQLAKCGLKTIFETDIDLRKEGNATASGTIFVCRK